MTIIRPTTINARFSQPIGLGGEKLWLCPTLGGDRLDLSGNGNHGTYYGGMGTVVSKYRGTKAFLFDGSNTQRIECDADVIGSEPVFSVSCWAYVNQHDATYGEGFVSQFGAGNNSATCKFNLATVAPSSSITPAGYIRPSTSNIAAISSKSIEAQTWHHLCFIADGSKTFIYLDGFLKGTNTYTGTVRTVTNPLVIGTYNQLINQNHYLNGMVDDVRAYSRTLTPTEIKHLASYRGVLGSPRQPCDPLKRTVVRVPAAIPAATVVGSIKKPKTIIKPSYQAGYARNASESENPNLWDGLVGAWMPSFGVTGETLRDVSGNGNHGTLTNMDASSDWVATSKGLALDMFSPNDSIDAGSMDDFSDELTINIVEKTNANTDGIRISLGSTTACNFGFQNNSNLNLRLFCRPSGQNYVVVNSVAIRSINSFATYSLTFNRGSVKFWKNGKVFSTHSFGLSSLPASTNELTIGAFAGYVSGGAYVRQFTSLQLYNRALSPSEIKQLYVESLAPFRRKQRVSVAVPAAVAPSATYHPLRSLAHPLEQ